MVKHVKHNRTIETLANNSATVNGALKSKKNQENWNRPNGHDVTMVPNSSLASWTNGATKRVLN